MPRALLLALNGPAYGVNPQVGAVIINSDGAIVAEGWHRGAGTAHAEVDALNKLAEQGIDPLGLTYECDAVLLPVRRPEISLRRSDDFA